MVLTVAVLAVPLAFLFAGSGDDAGDEWHTTETAAGPDQGSPKPDRGKPPKDADPGSPPAGDMPSPPEEGRVAHMSLPKLTGRWVLDQEALVRRLKRLPKDGKWAARG